MKILGRYRNGNYFVTLLEDGTKIRSNNLDNLTPDTIESFDMKITNQCDMGCVMCHENSTPDGLHGDILSSSFIDNLHPFTEIAIGGGNPLSHPDLLEFLRRCKENKFIPSMTVNQVHFMKDYDFVKKLCDEKLIYGLGISLVKITNEFIDKVKAIPNAVIHTIAGLTTIEKYKQLANKDLKILVLGYKRFRRGESLYEQESETIDKNIQELKNCIWDIAQGGWFKVLSFDNLALEQLDIKSHMSEEDWDKFFMGDDGIGDEFNSATMYVDMVKREFAKNSCGKERYKLKPTIEEMYNFLCNQHKSKIES